MHYQSNLKNTQVILLRHGQSSYNALGLYQGNSDHSNLTAIGRQQAQETAEFLRNIKIDAIYCSPLERAQETAKIVSEALSKNYYIAPELAETALPAWQGLSFQSENNFQKLMSAGNKPLISFAWKLPKINIVFLLWICMSEYKSSGKRFYPVILVKTCWL